MVDLFIQKSNSFTSPIQTHIHFIIGSAQRKLNFLFAYKFNKENNLLARLNIYELQEVMKYMWQKIDSSHTNNIELILL